MNTNLSQFFLIFIHIQKTGGVTFNQILRHQYDSIPKRLSNKFIIKFIINRSHSSFEQFLSTKKYPYDKYFTGHYGYGLHKWLPQPYRYFTFIREPISRLLSLYFYSKSNPTAYYHKHAQGDPCQFFFDTGLHELDNGMVRFIAGDPYDKFINRTHFGKCSHSLLEQAIENINNDFIFVGILEKFDESLLLLQSKLNWGLPLYLKRNTNSKGLNQYSSVHQDIIAELRELNQFDILLYQYCNQKLTESINQEKNFTNKLNNFLYLNRVYKTIASPIYEPYIKFKGLLNHSSQYPQ